MPNTGKISVSKTGVREVLSIIQRLYPTMNPAELDAAVSYARTAAELIAKTTDEEMREKIEAMLGAPLDAYVEQCKEKRKTAQGIGAVEEIQCYIKMLLAILLIQPGGATAEEEIWPA